jgi:3-oxo-5alpha-steroid 4-dehydrogenase
MNDFPNIIQSIDVESWAESADVVVVGFGVAGACAAIEAGEAGADVLVLERGAGGGGASALSGGIFYLGGGTPVQEACGQQDDPENMFRYIMASTRCPDARLVRYFCDSSVEHFNWLEGQGIPFERSYYKGKAVMPPAPYGLCDTGNEKLWSYREIARPSPRGHRVATTGGTPAGAIAMQKLIAKCESLGVRASYNMRVVGLVKNATGRVVGARVKRFGDVVDVRAKKAVVMAAGGFCFNREMVNEHAPHVPESAEPLGIPSNDGDGVRLGLSAGGVAQAMDGVMATGSYYPPEVLIKGILVNSCGERFVNEDSYHGRTASLLMDQPGAKAYLILDAETFAYPGSALQREKAKQALVGAWETVVEMEHDLNLPVGSLQRTLAEYNQGAAEGKDPLLNKHKDWLQALDKAPYAAFDVSFASLNYVFITLGGLKINEKASVLDAMGMPIPGFFAAGACVSHFPSDGSEYASGMSLGPGSFYGRVAGRSAAS